ncbi:MAG TPA: response regulator [Gemmataceae bacterium]|nr:response regulator [Gemmataceae bacterium]
MNSSRPLLLVVDDAPDMVLIVQRLGKWSGHDVISRPNVPSAWEYLCACVRGGNPPRPDLVVVDLHLPGPSGLELCRRLRSTPALAGLPVALFGSWDRPDDIAAALQVGVDFVLPKDLLNQPEAWRERVVEILHWADSRSDPISLSCLQGLSPSQQANRLLEALNQTLRHPTVRRLGREVVRALIRRAGERSSFPGLAEWSLSDDLTLACAGLTACPEAVQRFASILAEQLGCLLGAAACELFRVALQDALARPIAAVPMKLIHAILLVEDNPADVQITQRALQESGGKVELIVVRDGQEAMDYLLRRGAFADRPDWRSPDLILLDLNLPRLTGLEVLRRIRATPALQVVPVVVLTTSRWDEDVRQVYAAGANTYIEKPQDFDRFVEILRIVQTYWLDIALLPPVGT